MPERRRTTLVGAALLLLGLLLVLSRLGDLGAVPAFLRVALLFAAGGVAWFGSAGRWPMWQRIVVFAAIGAVAIPTAGRFAGTAALGYPAMAFLVIYLARPRHWWALIPAGVLASVGLVTTSEELFPRWDASPLLFLGFAATFTALYLLPRGRGGQRWALYPALGWIFLTVMVNDPGGSSGWMLPLALIGSGALLLWFWQRKR